MGEKKQKDVNNLIQAIEKYLDSLQSHSIHTKTNVLWHSGEL